MQQCKKKKKKKKKKQQQKTKQEKLQKIFFLPTYPTKKYRVRVQQKKKKKKKKIRMAWVTYWKILCIFLFLKVSKPLYGYSQYVNVILFTLPISVMW